MLALGMLSSQKIISKSFASRLKWSFVILTSFAIIQAALTLWVAYQSDYHIEKGRISNRILTEFIDLGGNKQRLKVWLAQYLLTNDSSTDVRNSLIFKMNNSINSLESLLKRDAELNQNNRAEVFIIEEQKTRFDTLKSNIKKLELEVNKIDKIDHQDPGRAWKFMIQVFDSLDGNDLKKIINDAIEIQKLRAAEAETTSKNYIFYFNNAVYFLTGLIVVVTVMLTLIIQNAVKQPLQSLVQAAAEFSKGNVHFRIQQIPDNEFGIVGQKFNEMAHELEKARQDEIQKRSQIEQEVLVRTQELKMALEKLQKSEFERKIFLSNVSHELKTPATAILGEASVTLRGSDKDIPTYKETLTNIQMIGRQLSNRIDDLLLLARADSDFFRINLTSEKSASIVQYVEEALKIADPLHQIKINLKHQLDQSDVLIDRDRMIQMLVILIENAARYGQANCPVDILLTNSSAKLQMTFQNTSDYIRDINFSQIFERYYRGHLARQIRPDGLGIGLNLAQTIVKAHYGTIKAEAVDNKFFSLKIEIPLKGLE